MAHLAPGAKVTVTASPRRGLDATLEVAERLTAAGYSTVPHLSARLVRDAAHLSELLDRVLAAGVRELFVLAGDAAEPAGEFSGAEELLVAMGERRSEFDAIGITGYPESHHLISDEETIRAMFAKAPMATHIVSQICFDAATIESWIAEVRRRGTDLPIWIGLPGHVAYAKLMRVSLKIGLGESARYLRHHRSWMARLLTRQFKPDRLIRDLDPCVTNPSNRVAGFHLYTFNEVGQDRALAPSGAGAAGRLGGARGHARRGRAETTRPRRVGRFMYRDGYGKRPTQRERAGEGPGDAACGRHRWGALSGHLTGKSAPPGAGVERGASRGGAGPGRGRGPNPVIAAVRAPGAPAPPRPPRPPPAASTHPPPASTTRSPSPRRPASPCRTGRRPRASRLPVATASRARSSLISPARSSIHMCAPPAPQQNVRLPLRSISIGLPTAATSDRAGSRARRCAAPGSTSRGR